jgi:hypothetical protein
MATSDGNLALELIGIALKAANLALQHLHCLTQCHCAYAGSPAVQFCSAQTPQHTQSLTWNLPGSQAACRPLAMLSPLMPNQPLAANVSAAATAVCTLPAWC